MAKKFNIPSYKSLDKIKRKKAAFHIAERILIVCEGEKTEPLYFEELARTLGILTLDINGECGASPISVANYGIKKFNDDKDYQYVFFVFDRDSHSTYDQAIEKIKNYKNKKYKNIFYIITSFPSFEYWLLLHCEDTNKPYDLNNPHKTPSQFLLSDLKKHAEFKSYKKNDNSYYENIKDFVDTASDRAEKNYNKPKIQERSSITKTHLLEYTKYTKY